jgi:LacI family transcriptional regulator
MGGLAARQVPPATGHFGAGGAKAADVARALGVSQATVSYALRGLPGVSSATRRLILETAARLGVALPAQEPGSKPPAPVARAKRSALGLVLADLGNPFYSDLAVEVVASARQHGYDVFVSHTGDEPEAVADAVRALADHCVRGVLLTAANCANTAVFAELRASAMPSVQISRRVPGRGTRFVGIDDEAAARGLMVHVLRHGYRDIALAAGPPASPASAARARGFAAALREAGLRLPRGRCFTTELGAAGGWRIAEHLLRAPRLPEVIVCGTDAMALGAIDWFRERGLRVPGDIALTGFDGLESVGTRAASLTSVVQPRAAMAREAVALLLSALGGSSTGPRTVLCPHSLRIGASCGCRPPVRNLPGAGYSAARCRPPSPSPNPSSGLDGRAPGPAVRRLAPGAQRDGPQPVPSRPPAPSGRPPDRLTA